MTTPARSEAARAFWACVDMHRASRASEVARERAAIVGFWNARIVVTEQEAELARLRAREEERVGLAALLAAMAEAQRQWEEVQLALLRVVADTDNSDMSVCYRFCPLHFYDDGGDDTTGGVVHVGPCFVETVRRALGYDDATGA